MSDDERPDPERMLERATAEAARASRGRLKVFFGAAPGVGKTFAMLEAARARRAEGIDVVIGWVETHGRAETEALAEGLERIPPRVVEHRGITLLDFDFDLDAALARRPGLILLDELAHLNAPGARHERRWQEIDELLAAGLDVYTTLNVQHLESVHDLVEHTTGVSVRETVPDSVFDRADEITLVDLPPDELLQRMRAGKVYLPAHTERAFESFFRKGNLIVLRELSLRRAAERVDAQVTEFKREHGVSEVWPGRERVLVAFGPDPRDADVVRAGFRLATQLRAPWLAVAVETPGSEALDAFPERTLGIIGAHLELAQQLGAETLVVRGTRIAHEILTIARARNVSRVVVGGARGPLRRLLGSGLAQALIRDAEGIEVVVTPGEQGGERPVASRVTRTAGARAYAWAFAAVAGTTGLCWLARPVIGQIDAAMIYLLTVLIVSTLSSRGPATVASIASVAAFDVFFVEPYFTLVVSDPSFLITFGVMLVTALIVSTLHLRVRAEAGMALERERRTAALSAMVRELTRLSDAPGIATVAIIYVEDLIAVDAAIVLRGREADPLGRGDLFESPQAQGAIRWVLEHGRPAGWSTDTLPAVPSLLLPLEGPTRRVGVLACRARDGSSALPPSRRQLLDTLVERIAGAIERTQLATEILHAQVTTETERTRSTLLSAISHDLRTPLTSIAGAASLLRDSTSRIGEKERAELLGTIGSEADRLVRLVGHLLDLTRIESGAIRISKEWIPVEEVLASAVERVAPRLDRERVSIQVPEEMLLVQADPVLLEQVFVNLLENAHEYATGAQIEITGWAESGRVVTTVEDRGPGIPPGLEERIFERFFRVEGRGSGSGLGLAVGRAIAYAHGGNLTAERRPGGGTTMRLVLPVDGSPPPLVDERATA